MTTLKQPTETSRIARMPRLRGIAAATALVPLLALGACSSEAPVTGTPTRTEAATATAAGTAASSTSEPGASTASAPPTTSGSTTGSAPAPTSVPVKVSIKDPVLGHTVTVTEVLRNMAFPAGYPVASENFEIVGVYVTLSAGSQYSADLDPQRLTIQIGSSYVRPTSEFGPTFAKTVTTAKRGETKAGYLIFKVDKGTSPLILMLHRPAYQVSTTDKAIPSQVFRAKLTD